MRTLISIGLCAGIVGCASAPTSRPVAEPARASTYATTGLERVIGKNAAGLIDLFGRPDADVRESNGRKLQFSGAICVLDAYLYPKGSSEPNVTWLDARNPDGSTIDRASCVAALTRRDGGR